MWKAYVILFLFLIVAAIFSQSGSYDTIYAQGRVGAPELSIDDTLTVVHIEIEALQDTTTDVHSTLSAFQSANGDTLTDIHTLNKTIESVVNDIEADVHSSIFLYSRKAVQTGTSKADTSAVAFYPFVLTAAADSTYGAAVQVLGTADTPRVSGNTTFHVAGFMVEAVNSNTIYKVRLVWGASVAAGLAASQFTETWVFGDTANPQQSQPTAIAVHMSEVAVGTEVWIQIANASGAQTMDLAIDIAEHD